MINIYKILLIITLVIPIFAHDYKIAIFDYDDRRSNKITIAKHIEKQLKQSKLKFSQINQFSAKNNMKKALEILERLEEDDYDLVITITSDAIAPASHKLKTTPWLFTNVNNPEFFGINNTNKPGQNKSGVTYYVPVQTQLKFFKTIMNNNLHKIGFIFDDSSKSRQVEVREFRKASKKHNIKYEIKLIEQKEQLPLVVKELIKNKVDAIILSSSGKIYNNIDLIIEICTKQKIPIFSVNKSAVEKGALAAFSSDYFLMVDNLLVPMAIKVLKEKKSPGEIPIEYTKEPLLYLNITQAKKLGISISDEIQEKASFIF